MVQWDAMRSSSAPLRLLLHGEAGPMGSLDQYIGDRHVEGCRDGAEGMRGSVRCVILWKPHAMPPASSSEVLAPSLPTHHSGGGQQWNRMLGRRWSMYRQRCRAPVLIRRMQAYTDGSNGRT